MDKTALFKFFVTTLALNFSVVVAMEKQRGDKSKFLIESADAKELEIPEDLASLFQAFNSLMAGKPNDEAVASVSTLDHKTLKRMLKAAKDISSLVRNSDEVSLLGRLPSVSSSADFLSPRKRRTSEYSAHEESVRIIARLLNILKNDDSQKIRELFEELEDLLPIAARTGIKASILFDHKNLPDLCLSLDLKTGIKVSSEKRIAGIERVLIAQVSHSGEFLIAGRTDSKVSLYDLRSGLVQKMLDFQCSSCSFSPDGNFLLYTVHADTENFVIIFDLQTQKQIETSFPLHMSAQFSADSADVIIGRDVFNAKTGKRNLERPMEPRTVREGGVCSVEFSKDVSVRVPQGLAPLQVLPNHAFCRKIPHDLTCITKLLRNGSLEKIGLPDWPLMAAYSLMDIMISPSGSLLVRVLHGSSGTAMLNVVDLEDDPKVLFSIDVRDDINLKTFCFVDKDTFCILTANKELVVINGKTKLVKRIAAPCNLTAENGISFVHNNRLVVCYEDRSAYLYLNIDGASPLKALELREPGNKEEFNRADFSGWEDGSLITHSKDEELKIWNVHYDTILKCSFSELFMLIKLISNPVLLKDKYFGDLYASLREDVKKVLAQRDLKPADRLNEKKGKK
jgi:WD40 repeat protein